LGRSVLVSKDIADRYSYYLIATLDRSELVSQGIADRYSSYLIAALDRSELVTKAFQTGSYYWTGRS
jgi:hypothetical protein